jgi:hypothetical protein
MEVCNSHLHYPTALIHTEKFDGFGMWCPFCGRKMKKFGDNVINVPDDSKEIAERNEIYKKASAKYLRGEAQKWKYNEEAENLRV